MNKEEPKWYKYYDKMRKHLDYPDISIYKLLENTFENHLDNISYIYDGKEVTCKEFLNQIDECSKALLELGVKHKDIVSICMTNTPEAIISFYAINKIGGVANMIHPESSETEIKYFLELTNSKYIICIEKVVEKIKKLDSKINKCIITNTVTENKMKYISWEYFINKGKKSNKKVTKEFNGSETALILYSGGTTGNPKGIELTNLNFNALAMQTNEAIITMKEKDKLLAIMPIFHGYGLGICIHTVQYAGATSILLPNFNTKILGKLIKQYHPNIFTGVPTMYEAMLKSEELKNYDLSFIKSAMTGGDSLSKSLKEKFDNFFKSHGANIQVREGYGLTESVTASCLMPEKHYKENSIGIPFPDTYYKIVKIDTIEEVPNNTEGEICINGPTVMKGYFKNEEETKKVLKKHKDGKIWLHTGDLGYMDEDGFVYFKQRIKRLIKSSGYCIYPQYLENIIDSHEYVLMSSVIGIPHSYKGQVAKAFIVLKDGIEPTEKVLNSIKKHCEKNIAKYSLPYEYEIRDNLPRTKVGKVDYLELEKEEQNKNDK